MHRFIHKLASALLNPWSLLGRFKNCIRGASMGLSAMIEYVCTSHRTADGLGPKVTLIDGAWALCVGQGQDGHQWTRIEPTRREFIGDPSRDQRLQTS
jgi:hypothetical protein